MGDAGLLPLVVRTVVSLLVVLAVIAVAYAIARRRAPSGGWRPKRAAPAPAIEVVGRAGLARGSSAVALRFGDRVVMVGVTEQAPTAVLADIDAARWDELHPVEETLVPTEIPDGRSPTGPAPPRQSFFEALRTATSRRA